MIDIHTHKDGIQSGAITIQNRYPGEGFAAFFSTNYYSIGLHPWHIKSDAENVELLQKVRKALQFEHVIAVGECGLDKLKEIDITLQEQVFNDHIKLSEEFKRPLIIHCVKAYNEILQIRKSSSATMPWILHSFNGNIQTSRMFENDDFMFSFGNILFQENSKAIESFKYLPLGKIFLETDELDLPIEKVYIKAAQLKGISIDELLEAIKGNFKRIFKPV